MEGRNNLKETLTHPIPEKKFELPPIPEEFRCPISHQKIMWDPILVGNGKQAVEKAVLENWVKKYGTDPFTSQPFNDFIPATTLTKKIADFLKQYPEYVAEVDIPVAIFDFFVRHLTSAHAPYLLKHEINKRLDTKIFIFFKIFPGGQSLLHLICEYAEKEFLANIAMQVFKAMNQTCPRYLRTLLLQKDGAGFTPLLWAALHQQESLVNEMLAILAIKNPMEIALKQGAIFEPVKVMPNREIFCERSLLKYWPRKGFVIDKKAVNYWKKIINKAPHLIKQIDIAPNKLVQFEHALMNQTLYAGDVFFLVEKNIVLCFKTHSQLGINLITFLAEKILAEKFGGKITEHASLLEGIFTILQKKRNQGYDFSALLEPECFDIFNAAFSLTTAISRTCFDMLARLADLIGAEKIIKNIGSNNVTVRSVYEFFYHLSVLGAIKSMRFQQTVHIEHCTFHLTRLLMNVKISGNNTILHSMMSMIDIQYDIELSIFLRNLAQFFPKKMFFMLNDKKLTPIDICYQNIKYKSVLFSELKRAFFWHIPDIDLFTSEILAIAIKDHHLEYVKFCLTFFEWQKDNFNVITLSVEERNEKIAVCCTPLMYACVLGKIEILDYLVKKGANIHSAILFNYGLFKLMSPAVELPPYFHHPGFKDISLLWLACKFSQPNVIKWLCQQGSDPNKKILNTSLLEMSCGWGDPLVFKALLSCGAKISPAIWQIVIKSGNVAFLDYLRQQFFAEIKFNSNEIKDDCSLLMRAVKLDHFNMVKYLIEEGGADLHWKNKEGDNALDIAFKRRHHEIMILLLEHKCVLNILPYAHINYFNLNLDGLINTAVAKYHSPLMQMCLQVIGITREKLDYFYWPSLIPLLHCAAIAGDLSTVRFIAKQGKANMNWQDNNGNTAAHAAIKSGNMAVYRFLNSHQLGVDVNIPNNKGETAAELAFHFRKNKLQQKLQGLLKEKQILSQRHGLFDGIRRQYLQSKIDGLKLKLDQLMIEKMRLQTVM